MVFFLNAFFISFNIYFSSARSIFSIRGEGLTGVAVAPTLTPIPGSGMQSKEVTFNPTPILPAISQDGEYFLFLFYVSDLLYFCMLC